ncbi:MAG: response regulator [Bacteroidota bacterium]|nr:response regulator [Bacteroidota bacterium]
MSKILILDDDQDLLSIVKSLLKKNGFDVWAFANWQKAWEDIKRNKPNLILLDVFLKGMDGMDVCKKLKASTLTRNIPVIMFSSYPNIAETAIAEFGADEFIAKPFEVNEMVRKIKEVLSVKRVVN